MPWWAWLIIVGVFGIALILVGALRDRALRHRRTAMLKAPPPPVRGVVGGDAVPHYVSLEEARAPRTPEPLPPLDDPARALTTTAPLRLALADPGFATTADGYAQAEHPIVLTCAEPITTVRELYPILAAARNTGAPLVIVAPAIDATTTQTLVINQTHGLLRVLAVTGDAAARGEAARRCRAQPVERADLQAGYLPHEQLGGCPLWVSTGEQTWIAPPSDGPAATLSAATVDTPAADPPPPAEPDHSERRGDDPLGSGG